jgi:hypothetical protein
MSVLGAVVVAVALHLIDKATKGKKGKKGRK